jgi:hypothetical protein
MKDPDHPSKRTSTRLHVYSGRTAGQNEQRYMYKYIHPYIALEDAPQYSAVEHLPTHRPHRQRRSSSRATGSKLNRLRQQL